MAGHNEPIFWLPCCGAEAGLETKRDLVQFLHDRNLLRMPSL